MPRVTRAQAEAALGRIRREFASDAEAEDKEEA